MKESQRKTLRDAAPNGRTKGSGRIGPFSLVALIAYAAVLVIFGYFVIDLPFRDADDANEDGTVARKQGGGDKGTSSDDADAAAAPRSGSTAAHDADAVKDAASTATQANSVAEAADVEGGDEEPSVGGSVDDSPDGGVGQLAADSSTADVGEAGSAESRIPRPWDDVIQRQGPLPPFEQVAFAGPSNGLWDLHPNELKPWLESIDGHASRIDPTRSRRGRGRGGIVRGLLRLNAPWRDDLALRVSTEQSDHLLLHFFVGRRGATLTYHRRYKDAWAGYVTRRQADAVRPDRYALTATDQDRNYRTLARLGADYLIRYYQGQLIVSRGDVVLLRTPLGSPPEDVFWDGNAAIGAIEVVRCGPPPEPTTVATASWGVERPAELDWQVDLPASARLEPMPDGSVQLWANQADRRGSVRVSLPTSEPQEVLLQIQDATPGSGVFLGRPNGVTREVLRYVHNRRSGETCLMARMDDDARDYDFAVPSERIVPAVPTRHWLRLVFGCGQLRWSISADGQNWAEHGTPLTRLPGDVVSLGLQHVARADDCRLRLLHIETRPLLGFQSLAEEFHASGSVSLPQESEDKLLAAKDLAAWREIVHSTRPADCEPAMWEIRAAVRSLARGPSDLLGNALLEWLLDEAPLSLTDLESRLTLLHDAALLMNLKDDRNRLLRFLDRYHQLTRDALATGGAKKAATIRCALMSAPISTPHTFEVVDPKTTRAQLIDGVYQGDWENVRSTCVRLQFFHQQPKVGLLDWAAFLSGNHATSGTMNLTARRRADWQHPLWEELDKEAYNTLSELQAMAEEQSWEDAARMISAMRPEQLPGLAPTPNDGQLLASVGSTLRGYLEEPELGRVMREQMNELAGLRISAAVANEDAAALELAAIQFSGTPAAAEAHRWLGDQALAAGWFARAETEYGRGLSTAASTLRPQLESRRRLVAAMQGRDEGSPTKLAVKFAGQSMQPDDFEALIAELRNRASDAAGGAVGSDARSLPEPSELKLRNLGAIGGPQGDKPTAEVTRYTRQLGVCWVERQMAAVVRDKQLFVSNRFQVTAYDVESGKRSWQTGLPGKHARAQDWTGIAMKPLVDEGRVFARQLADKGPVLVCLDQASGEPLWSTEPNAVSSVVSDPFRMQNSLFVFKMARGAQQQSRLHLERFEADTGNPLESHVLLTVGDVWWKRRVCEVTCIGDRIYAVLGGIVACCGVDGTVHWLRKQTVLPPQEEYQWIRQYAQPPLVDDERCFVTQPGVRTCDCIDTRTGRLVWRRTLPEVRRSIGLSGALVVVETEREIIALDRADGKTVWRFELQDVLEARYCDERFVIVAAREQSGKRPTELSPRLIWLDASNGAPAGDVTFSEIQHREPRLGPLAVGDHRLFAFVGKGNGDPERELVEIVKTP